LVEILESQGLSLILYTNKSGELIFLNFCQEDQQKLVSNFEQGCQSLLEHMRRSRFEQTQENSKELLAWEVQIAALHEKAWTSMKETHIKNSVLIEEWLEEVEGIKEGISIALERLDPVEESKLKAQLLSVETRIRDARQDNEALEGHIHKVELAFEPILLRLNSGSLGQALSSEEKLKAGLSTTEWAFWLGDGTRKMLVKDLTPNMEAFALQQRQHRLEQLRKSHKREFELIQRMKERLHSDTLKAEHHRNACVTSSPAKMLLAASKIDPSESGSLSLDDSLPFASDHKRARNSQHAGHACTKTG